MRKILTILTLLLASFSFNSCGESAKVESVIQTQVQDEFVELLAQAMQDRKFDEGIKKYFNDDITIVSMSTNETAIITADQFILNFEGLLGEVPMVNLEIYTKSDAENTYYKMDYYFFVENESRQLEIQMATFYFVQHQGKITEVLMP